MTRKPVSNLEVVQSSAPVLSRAQQFAAQKSASNIRYEQSEVLNNNSFTPRGESQNLKTIQNNKNLRINIKMSSGGKS